MPAPQLPNAYGFCEFFGLDPEEFIKVFIPNKKSQDEFGLLSPHSSPVEVGERIFEYLNSVLAHRDGNQISNKIKDNI